jgi:hypothetical protein
MNRLIRTVLFLLIVLSSPMAAAEEVKPVAVPVTAAAAQAPSAPVLVSWENSGNRSVRESRGGSFISWEANRGAANFIPQATFMNAAATNMRRQYDAEEVPVAPLAEREPVSRMVPLPKAPPASSEPVTPDYMAARTYTPSYTDYTQDVPVQNVPQAPGAAATSVSR